MTSSVDRQFDQFIKSFRYKNLMRYSDSLVYRTPNNLSDVMAKDANNLISKLKLDLVAIPTSLYKKDSFHVKSINTDEI